MAEDYQKKFISAEDAAALVKPGDTVVFTMGREAFAVGLALAARKGDFQHQGLKIYVPFPGYDFGWYDAGWEDSFDIRIIMPMPVCQDAVAARRLDTLVIGMVPGVDLVPAEVLITEVSPPDAEGYCSFGQSLWNKRQQIRAAKLVIAEVNENLIRTGGDNFIHVSELDYLVAHVALGSQPGSGTLAGRVPVADPPYLKQIAAHVAGLIRDGDTIQIGIGRTTEPLVRLGLLDGKKDIGYHSEATPPGIISLVKSGLINGKRKTLHPDKVVVTSLGGGSKEEMRWAADNPVFQLVDVAYLEDPRIIASHDNMVTLNNALGIDLSGQITAESLGPDLISAAGGQIAFVVGASLSKGGRAITVLPATAKDGTISRIVPQLPHGTVVTIQRGLADCIVTEYGVARLKGKTIRERARALIGIAHPDFRVELTREAERLWWP